MIHQRAAAVLIITILLYISISLLTNSNHSSISPANPLDGCTFVYLDMGTNVGVQIRKLYKPSQFPDAKVLPVFEKYFGKPEERNYSEICSVGWEPNPGLTDYLTQLESHLTDCGHRVSINTELGVGVSNSINRFIRLKQDPLLYKNFPMEMSSQFVSEEDIQKSPVFGASPVSYIKQIRIAEYILEVVATRRLPPGRRPVTVMKLDVEGPRLVLDITSDLLMSGALAHLDQLHIDWPWPWTVEVEDIVNSDQEDVEFSWDKESVEFQQALLTIQKYARTRVNLSHTTEIELLDDETYHSYLHHFNC